ncbi:Polyribonucleotide nucleotidyltransferase [Bienertia sinuspersici]
MEKARTTKIIEQMKALDARMDELESRKNNVRSIRDEVGNLFEDEDPIMRCFENLFASCNNCDTRQ